MEFERESIISHCVGGLALEEIVDLSQDRLLTNERTNDDDTEQEDASSLVLNINFAHI